MLMTIYDNYDVEIYREMAMDDLSDLCIKNPTQEEIDKYIEINMANDWDNLIEGVLCDHIEAEKWIAYGSIRRWDGSYHGWKVLEDARDFFDLIQDCLYFRIDDEDGLIKIKCSHHDGTNYYTLKPLTKHGYDFYRNYGWDYDNDRLGKYLIDYNFNSRKHDIEWCY